MSSSIRRKSILWMGALTLLLSVIFSASFYYSKQNILIKGIDDRLHMAATMAHEILPENYHDTISNAESVDWLTYRHIVQRYDRLSSELGLQYLWSVLVVDRDTIHFTSATSTNKKTTEGDYAEFFQQHSNPEAFFPVLDKGATTFSTFENKWGQGRMVLIPYEDTEGRTYLMGASISIDDVQAILDDVLMLSLLISSILVLTGIISALLFSESLIRPLEKLQSFARDLKEGRYRTSPPFKSYTEINDLIHSMQEMGEAIFEKVEQLQLSGKVFSNAAEAIVITDEKNIIIDLNPAFTRITGYSREEMLGKSPNVMNSGIHGPAFYEKMWHDITEFGQWSGEIWDRRKNGEVFPKKLSISSVKDELGRVQNYVGVFSDISEVKAAEDKLIHQTLHDSLTGLPNRTLYRDRLIQALSQARRDDQKIAVFILDIDHFKVINDAHGHWIGDSILKQVSKRLKSCLRESDTIARIGSDEFAIIMNNPSSSQDIEELARLMIEAVRAPVHVKKLQTLLTASLGIAVYPQDGQTHDSLTNNADAAMFEAKKQSRDSYRFFTSNTEKRVRSRNAIEIELRSALQNHEFELHYQPKIDLVTNQLTGVEALVRWNNRNKGIVAPDHFIPLAEETGLILPIGQWVIETACQQMKNWHEKGYQDLSVAVNLSPVQFRNQRIIHVIDQILTTVGLPAHALELEITEGIMVNDSEELALDLNRAKELGMTLAVDDFGTGYCSLAYLKRYPVDSLKIDRAFVKDITSDEGDDAIVSAIISMANVLKIKVVAEGIETEDQLELLKSKGCEEGQGYFFSRPLPPDECEKFFKAFGQRKPQKRYA